MRYLVRLGLLVTVSVIVGCQSPRAQANVAQALNDAGTQISAVQQDVAALQEQLDSLRQVVARQDTLVRRIAALNNVPVGP